MVLVPQPDVFLRAVVGVYPQPREFYVPPKAVVAAASQAEVAEVEAVEVSFLFPLSQLSNCQESHQQFGDELERRHTGYPTTKRPRSG